MRLGRAEEQLPDALGAVVSREPKASVTLAKMFSHVDC